MVVSAHSEVVPFGRYVLKERLAKGGMGEVFRAVAVGERGFEKPVVVKRILPVYAAMSELAEFFVEEAKLMTRLAHPNVVEVLDFGRGESGDYFLVLEYVPGLDLGRLAAWLRGQGKNLSIPLALYITTQALRGLHHAHTRAQEEGMVLVHRDVSPSNLLLSVEGEVKVADFGVALMRRAGEPRAPSGVVGKPAYMAPEQYLGHAIDPRADVFAMGVVLFELFTGTLPFEGFSDEERQDAALRGDFGRARDLRPEVTPELDAVIRRALAPNPEARFPDAKAMTRALAECGVTMAESDDAADLVREAVRATPSEKGGQGCRVIALSADTPRAGEDDDDPSGRELTRTGGMGGAAAFTLRMADEAASPGVLPQALSEHTPEPLGSSIVESTPPASRRREGLKEHDEDTRRAPASKTLWWIGALVGCSVVGVGVFQALNRSNHEDEYGPTPSPAPSASVSGSTPLVIPPSTAIEVVPQPLPMPTTAPVSSPVLRTQPRAAPSLVSAPTLPPSSSALAAKVVIPPPAEDCVGTVKIASNGSFTVSGGPSTVQSPGVYTWRCGSYSLRAVSRADPSQTKSAGVVVKAGSTAVVDLR